MNMKRLLEQLCGHPLDAAAAASILECSITSAYRYLNTLIDAAIIEIVKREQRASKPVPKLYRLKATQGDVDRLLATLSNSADPRPRVSQTAGQSTTLPGKLRSQAFFLFSGQGARPGQAPHVVERDPLVAALFGTVSRQTGSRSTCMDAGTDAMPNGHCGSKSLHP